jgi:two-component system, OmpR family, phosphate regulon sensor histidine kinase PhoR
MIAPRPLRIGTAVFIVAVIAVAAFVISASLLAAAFAVAAGSSAILLLATTDTQPLIQPPPEAGPVPTVIAMPAIEGRILEAISEPLIIAVDGRVQTANAAATALLGAHIAGEDPRLAIRHPAAAEMLAADARDGSVDLIGFGGRDQRVSMSVATLSPGVRLIHLIDRTTSYAAERARVDFVANASHELRTPLAAILGFIETLDDPESGGNPDVRARFLEVMHKEARRMQRLIDDLISLSRIEAEKYQPPDTPVSLPALIEEVADELRDEGGRRRADVILRVASPIPEVNADRAQLSQVIHNLAGNAFKYGRPGAPVTIALDREGSLIRLSVSDEGEGIAPEHIPRLTERFYRVDSGRSRTMGGTGLGLSIVKHIVERHRGRLDIASKLGLGTTVSVLLPAILPTAIQGDVTLTSQN